MTDKATSTVHCRKADPLGYDTNRPFNEVAREMAQDALSGRNQDAVDAELDEVRRKWNWRRDEA